MNPERIRNFSIIAHIDHGKSTLADRILQLTGAVADRDMEDAILDDMDLERERGITIKSHAVRLDYKAKDGNDYVLNLIDTPGHVDFSYEVSRSLSACEGALLVVDASQGVEAQTLANTYLALENDLELIPVLNKIDLPSAEPDRIKEQIENIIGLDTSEAVLTSRKNRHRHRRNFGSRSSKKFPPPKGDPNAPLKALIFDSWYDSYRGVIVLFRVIEGTIKKGTKISFFNTGREYLIETIGVNRPRPTPINELQRRRSRILHRFDQNRRRRADRRHDHRSRAPGRNAFSRLSGSQTDGFRRALPDRYCAIRRAARRDGQTAS